MQWVCTMLAMVNGETQMSDWATCRFCKETAHQDRMVKYGVRHYAHFNCYLDNKTLHKLLPWQIGQFPWKLIKERGLEAEAAECSRR